VNYPKKTTFSFLWVFIFLTFFSKSLFAEVDNNFRLDTEAKKTIGFHFGFGVDLDVFSNAFTFQKIIDQQFDNPNVKNKDLFAYGIARLETFLEYEGNCRLGFEKSVMAMATSNKQTLDAYSNYTGNGITSGSNYPNLVLNMTALEGQGTNFGCTYVSQNNFRINITGRLLNINNFTEHKYSGSISEVPDGLLGILNETWVRVSPQIDDLQQSGQGGRAGIVDFKFNWNSSDKKNFTNLNIYNLYSKVQVQNYPYMTRNFNAIYSQGSIYQNENIQPLTGRYGNQNFSGSLPRIWAADFGHLVLNQAYVGMMLNGLDNFYQPSLFINLGCSGCSVGRGYRINIDQNLTTLGLGYFGNSFSLFLATQMNEGFNLSSINQIRFNYRFKF